MIAVRRLAAAAVLAALTGISVPTTATAAPAPAPATTDAPFLRAIHQGNMAEIAAGLEAGKSATKACVKTVGATLVTDHRKLDVAVVALAKKLHVTLPASVSRAQKKAAADIQAKAGKRGYNAAWLANEATGHVQTLALIDRELKSGANSEVKAAAKTARPIVAHHLEIIRACQGTKRS
ncbi:DUF4142 domain-containing protein [Streptomyces sp. NPDC091292]|uniref:DUF4142 domain-containing protein n=1 Tax=Streptomyces sp. NPDC091292 TaxID=3365991 RepID=UPI003817BE16